MGDRGPTRLHVAQIGGLWRARGAAEQRTRPTSLHPVNLAVSQAGAGDEARIEGEQANALGRNVMGEAPRRQDVAELRGGIRIQPRHGRAAGGTDAMGAVGDRQKTSAAKAEGGRAREVRILGARRHEDHGGAGRTRRQERVGERERGEVIHRVRELEAARGPGRPPLLRARIVEEADEPQPIFLRAPGDLVRRPDHRGEIGEIGDDGNRATTGAFDAGDERVELRPIARDEEHRRIRGGEGERHAAAHPRSRPGHHECVAI